MNKFTTEIIARFALDSQVIPEEISNINKNTLILKKEEIIKEQNKLKKEWNKLEAEKKAFKIFQEDVDKKLDLAMNFHEKFQGKIKESKKLEDMKTENVQALYNKFLKEKALFNKEKEEFLKKYSKEFSQFQKEKEKGNVPIPKEDMKEKGNEIIPGDEIIPKEEIKDEIKEEIKDEKNVEKKEGKKRRRKNRK